MKREKIAAEIGACVAHARAAMDVTETELAQIAGVSRGTIVRLEAALSVPSTLTICKLALAFYCEPSDLVPNLSVLEELGS